MKLSVNIVTRGRLSLFKKCCYSVARALPEGSEVVVFDQDGDASRWLSEWCDDRFRSVRVPAETLARSRNRAFLLCRGEILYCLDDDVTVPKDLFSFALQEFDTDPELGVLGGPNLTPDGSSWKQRLFGAVMQSPVAAPWVFVRYTPRGRFRADERHLIFCNLAFRRSRLPRGLRFREDLKSNEENSFLEKCGGLPVRYDSRVFVWHERRPTFRSFASQIRSYGFGRAQQVWASFDLGYLPFFVPALSLLVAPWMLLVPKVAFAVAFIYGLAILIGAKRVTGKLWERGGVVVLTPLVHLFYGAGFLRGSAWALFQRLRPVRPPIVHAYQGFDRSKIDPLV